MYMCREVKVGQTKGEASHAPFFTSLTLIKYRLYKKLQDLERSH